MSQQIELLTEASSRLFRHVQNTTYPELVGWQAALWAEVEQLGLPLLLVPEQFGGVGADWEDAYAVLRCVGEFGVPLPVADAMLAATVASTAGLTLPTGVSTISIGCNGSVIGDGAATRFTGLLRGVPWGRNSATIVVVMPTQHQVLLLKTDAAWQLRKAENLAGEPRDDIFFEGSPVQCAKVAASDVEPLFGLAALTRTAMITGGLETALRQSVEYAKTRKQFGRAIGQFQAVQQQLALFGADAAAALCAGRAAARAATLGDASFQIAAAKLRANIAAGTATAIAHQVHAAIGFTQEFSLRRSTQRLWSWRSEFGNDRFWSERLGEMVLSRGAAQFWTDLTGRDDQVDLV